VVGLALVALGGEHHDHLLDLDSGKIAEFVDPQIERWSRLCSGWDTSLSIIGSSSMRPTV
jgi:hypothetical protein